MVITRCHCSQAYRCGCQFASVCELSLSFVWVEPILPGVAGACAFSLLKGRDELFHVAFAYAASFEPWHLNVLNRYSLTHMDSSSRWSFRILRRIRSSKIKGIRWNLTKCAKAPQKRGIVQCSQYARNVNWPCHEWNEVTAWADSLLNSHDKFRRVAPRYLMTVFLMPRRKAVGSPRASTGSRPHSRNPRVRT